MKTTRFVLPPVALAIAGSLLFPAELLGGGPCGFPPVGANLGLAQRDFRVFDNFPDAQSNNNTTPHAQFPGYTGVEMAIWKGAVEWGSILHGDGTGDPHQPTGLGSGGANFDPSFQGNTNTVGGASANIFSHTGFCGGATLAFTELPISDGWRIRFCDGNDGGNFIWEDGPGTNIGGAIDIQAVACHEYGHALGLGHTNAAGATMRPAYFGVAQRSINSSDQCGVQAIYGVASAGKPTITSVSNILGSMTITGSGFSLNNNEVWFTRANLSTNGTPVKLTGVPAAGGSTINISVPADAGPGDILVKNAGSGHASLSNAFPFDPTQSSCPDIVRYCTPASPNETGSPASINTAGSVSVAANDLSFSVFPLAAGNSGLIAYSPDQAATPLGNGTLCLGSQTFGFVFRLPGHAAVFDLFWYTFTHDLDITNPPLPQGQITVGSSWNFQGWYRDFSPAGSGFNFTDAVTVTFCP